MEKKKKVNARSLSDDIKNLQHDSVTDPLHPSFPFFWTPHHSFSNHTPQRPSTTLCPVFGFVSHRFRFPIVNSETESHFLTTLIRTLFKMSLDFESIAKLTPEQLSMAAEAYIGADKGLHMGGYVAG